MKTSIPALDGPAADGPAEAMRAALAAARRGQLAGEPPVGACVVQDGRVIAAAHTAVIGGPDATAHAEILALRMACRHARTPWLDGCALYATVEPCAMCLAASHYAGIRQVWFGAALDAMQAVTGRELKAAVPDGMIVTGGLLAADCASLLREWAESRGRPR
ncbi:MAG: nucleoside deaminase [Gammaproteobacteria bacterium]